MSQPSPYVSVYVTRRQAEALVGLLRELPPSRVRAIEKRVVAALNENRGDREPYESAERPS